MIAHENEQIYLIELLRVTRSNYDFKKAATAEETLLQAVRANAVRDAAKALDKQSTGKHLPPSVAVNWLFDRADNIDSGRL